MKISPAFTLTLSIIFLSGAWPIAAAADTAEELMKLSEEYWELHLRTNPVSATALGDQRYDHLLSDNSPEAADRVASELEEILGRAAGLDGSTLSGTDRITLNALKFQIRSRLARIDCELDSWTVDPLGGPQVSLFNIPSQQTLTDHDSGQAMLQRWRAMGPYLDQHVANIRRGLGEDKVTIRISAERVISQIDELAETPIADWALMKPALDSPEAWTASQREEFKTEMMAVVSETIRPALMRYRELLEQEVLPQTRGQDRPGVMHVAGGAECYRNMILLHTSLTLEPEAIHAIGLEEVERINQELRGLGKEVLGTDDLEEIHRRLREDPDMHFATRDEVAGKAEEALRRAEAVMSDWFGILPQAPCRVLRMEAHEEKHSTIAYYRRPAADGSRPGTYYINTYAPKTRPRYEAEALAFHEAVPGHHLQIAIMQELTDLPDFRKHSGVTAFVEGWALYTERLSNEMGLYSSDADRIGMLSYDSWRACRLVVDTGLHALGWTRQEAINFMVTNTVLAENNITNEVDRYITWPGQALAYKLGQREIFRLRAEAKEWLGERFDIKGFHDAVLGQGAVDLQTLGSIVEEWIAATAAAAD